MAVECMKNYIEHSQFSAKEKEELKKNYEHWADVTLVVSNKGCVIAINCMNKKDKMSMLKLDYINSWHNSWSINDNSCLKTKTINSQLSNSQSQALRPTRNS